MALLETVDALVTRFEGWAAVGHALAHERTASFCYLRNDATTGRTHMNASAALHQKWETWAKVEALRTTGLEHPLV